MIHEDRQQKKSRWSGQWGKLKIVFILIETFLIFKIVGVYWLHAVQDPTENADYHS